MGTTSNIPIAPDDNKGFVIGGGAWNAMRAAATRGQNLSATAGVGVQNDPTGTTLTFDAAPQLVMGYVHGPTEDNVTNAILFQPLIGPINPDYYPPEIEIGSFGKAVVDADGNAIYAEGWGLGAESLGQGTPVWGWHIGNRDDAHKGRQVVFLAGIGIPRPTLPYQVYTPLDDTLLPVWTSARWT